MNIIRHDFLTDDTFCLSESSASGLEKLFFLLLGGDDDCDGVGLWDTLCEGLSEKRTLDKSDEDLKKRITIR